MKSALSRRLLALEKKIAPSSNLVALEGFVILMRAREPGTPLTPEEAATVANAAKVDTKIGRFVAERLEAAREAEQSA